MDNIPIGAFFGTSVIVVLSACEIGYRLGLFSNSRRKEAEKESPVAAISASILGLSAFMLAFTFGIVTDRYDQRKALVREEANAIGTAFLRSDFLPEADRRNSAGLFRKYLELRLSVTSSLNTVAVQRALAETDDIQSRLWDMAVNNARKDMHSDMAALYIESLNNVIDIHALRVAVGLQTRVPSGIWLGLFALVFMGMMGIGYQVAISGSRRSWAIGILAIAFSLVIVLIASLDRPQSKFIPVSQQPLIDVLHSITDRSKVQEP